MSRIGVALVVLCHFEPDYAPSERFMEYSATHPDGICPFANERFNLLVLFNEHRMQGIDDIMCDRFSSKNAYNGLTVMRALFKFFAAHK